MFSNYYDPAQSIIFDGRSLENNKHIKTLVGKRSLTINLRARTTAKKIIIYVHFHEFLSFKF